MNRAYDFTSFSLRSVFGLAAVGMAVAFGGCGDDDDSPTGPVTERGSLQQGKVVYAALEGGSFDVFALAAGGSPVNLTQDPALDQRPVWSPDGTRVAFVSDRSGDLEIYTMAADGSDVVQLTQRQGFDDAPVWSPDGSQIAFIGDSGGGNLDIYVMVADGSGLLRLTSSSGIDQRPAWSPDGSQIAFVSNRDSDAEIFRINADGTTERRLTNNNFHDDWPAWSPDGTQIAFESNRDGIREIYRMTAGGGGQTRVTNSSREVAPGVFQPRSSGRPVWSPDGTQLLFSGTRDDDGGELYWVPSDAAQPLAPTRLTSNNIIETDYQWGPDGTQVLYVGYTEGSSGTLFMLNLADSGVVRLLDGTASRPSWR